MRYLLVGRIFKGNRITKLKLYNLDTLNTCIIDIKDIYGINILNCDYNNGKLKLSKYSNLKLSKFDTFGEYGQTRVSGYSLATILNDYIKCTEMEVEKQHKKGRAKELITDTSFLNSRKFKENVQSLASYIVVNDMQHSKDAVKKLARLLYSIFYKIIKHRNGTKYEDMYWLIYNKNGDYNQFLDKIDSNLTSEIRYDELIDEIHKHYNKLITIHNHPSGYPPSYADIKSNYDNKYKYGIVIGHNGNLYLYKTLTNIELTEYNHEYRRLKNKGIKDECEIQYQTLVSLEDSLVIRRF